MIPARQSDGSTVEERARFGWSPRLRQGLLVAVTLGILTSWLLSPLWRHPDQVLAFNDGNIESVMSPLFAYPESLFRIWDDQTFFGEGQPGTGIAVWSLLETVLGPHHYRRWGPWLAIWWTGLCAYWTLRQLGHRRAPSWVGGIFFTLCGWTTTFALNGLLNRSLTLAFSLLVVGVLARNRARGDGWLGYLVAGGCLGLAVTQTPDVGAFFALALAVYSLLGRPFPGRDLAVWRRRVVGLGLVVLASFGTSWQAVSKMIDTQVADAGPATAGEPGDAWNWATQWSLPKGETLSLVLPDFHGASTRSADHPYWGLMGRWPEWQSASQGPANFRLHGYAFGVVATFLFLLAVVGCARQAMASRAGPGQRIEPGQAIESSQRIELWDVGVLLAGFAVALSLAWGRFFVVYRLFYELPFMDAIRSPEKWLGPATLFFGLLVALGAEHLGAWLRRQDDLLWRLGAGYWLTIALVGLWLLRDHQAEQIRLRLTELGRSSQIADAWQDSQTVAWMAILLAVALALGVRAIGIWGRPLAAYLLVATLMCVELLPAAARFVELHDYRSGLEDNRLTGVLDEALVHGRLKLVPPRHSKLNQWRLTQFVARAYPLYDPVSVSRLDAGYRALFDAFADRPLDLWRLGAVRFFLTTPQATTQLTSASDRFVRRARLSVGAWESTGESSRTDVSGEAIDLLELTDVLPPVRLTRSWQVLPDDEQGEATALGLLAQPSHPFAAVTLVQGRAVPPTQLDAEGFTHAIEVLERRPTRWLLDVSTEKDALLVRASRFDPRWVARLDGERVPVLRADTLFQAVAIPAGQSRLEFSFEPPLTGLWVAILGRLLLAGAVVWWLRDEWLPMPWFS
ncbi:MAG: hypothetical protein MPN21_18645 [Thermoanaerobaculia bacterium]|nr:hypothetical protein [Thermoanaerobaculia bacterium]